MHDFIHTLEGALSIPLPLAFALTAAFMASLGVIAAMLNRSVAIKVSGLLEIFSGVLLLGVTVTHLIGHALEEDPALGAVLMVAGALAGFLISRLGVHEHGECADATIRGAGLASVMAIGVHSLLDGGVYAASLGGGHGHDHGDLGAGAAAGLGLILHEGAEGVIAFFLSLGVFRKLPTAFFVALFAAAATTPLGTLAALWAGDQIGPAFLHMAFPVAAGFVGFAGASLLWPHLRQLLARLGVGQRGCQGLDDRAD